MKPLHTIAWILAAGACVAALTVCSGGGNGDASDPPPPPPPDLDALGPDYQPPAVDEPTLGEARTVYATYCASCHGDDGRGDAPAGATLGARPRNYHDARWQASITNDALRAVILEGGAKHGLSPAMPEHRALFASRPAVLDGLVHLIRRWGREP